METRAYPANPSKWHVRLSLSCSVQHTCARRLSKTWVTLDEPACRCCRGTALVCTTTLTTGRATLSSTPPATFAAHPRAISQCHTPHRLCETWQTLSAHGQASVRAAPAAFAGCCKATQTPFGTAEPNRSMNSDPAHSLVDITSAPTLQDPVSVAWIAALVFATLCIDPGKNPSARGCCWWSKANSQCGWPQHHHRCGACCQGLCFSCKHRGAGCTGTSPHATGAAGLTPVARWLAVQQHTSATAPRKQGPLLLQVQECLLLPNAFISLAGVAVHPGAAPATKKC